MVAAVHDLLEALSSAGVTIEAHGDSLRYRPRSALTTELLAAVKSYKQDLLKILPDSSLLLDDLGGSGSRSPGAASVAQAPPIETLTQTPADGDNYADREWARFLSVAVATSNGLRDPAEPVLPRGVPIEAWKAFERDFGNVGRRRR